MEKKIFFGSFFFSGPSLSPTPPGAPPDAPPLPAGLHVPLPLRRPGCALVAQGDFAVGAEAGRVARQFGRGADVVVAAGGGGRQEGAERVQPAMQAITGRFVGSTR